MSKAFFLILCITVFTGLLAVNASAQVSRKSVSGAEVTGTFRYTFPAKFKGSSSDIEILALGGGRLKVGFDLIYPHWDAHKNLTANTGQGIGEALIEGDTAVYTSDEFGPCKITIRFARPGTINVSQEGTDADCGFGHNVMADGVYKKISGKKAKV